jgi:hypothetical protein
MALSTSLEGAAIHDLTVFDEIHFGDRKGLWRICFLGRYDGSEVS